MKISSVVVERCTDRDLDDWAGLRCLLWPELGIDESRAEARELLSRRSVAYLARTPGAGAVGFAEATVRVDYVNGCTTSPVAFLEGIYVIPQFRRRGVARLLTEAVEEWAARMGCSELASDAEIDNVTSRCMHAALGFEETERVVCFRKNLSAS
jgi:aminoglycoside 6'-N-acetyltransferase I